MATATCKSGNCDDNGGRQRYHAGDHPCFNAGVKHKFGRMHLPVAPRCNIQCNYCNRRYDCHNECRPGVTAEVLSPAAALLRVEQVRQKLPNIAVIGIAGPGDPLANPEETFATFQLVRKKHPETLLCLSTNGLAAVDYLEDIVKSGVSHITVTINAIDPAIGAKIYRWVRVDGKTLKGFEGAALLLKRQLKTVGYLKKAGLLVKVNTVVIPGINDFHVVGIAREMEKLSVDLFNPMPLYPVEGTPFEHIQTPDLKQLKALRRQARNYLPQMSHCARCRADAIGLIGETTDIEDDHHQQSAAEGCRTNASCSDLQRISS